MDVEDLLAVGGDAPDAARFGQKPLDRHQRRGFVATQRRPADLDRTALDLESDNPVVRHRAASGRGRGASTWVGVGVTSRLPVSVSAPVP